MQHIERESSTMPTLTAIHCCACAPEQVVTAVASVSTMSSSPSAESKKQMKEVADGAIASAKQAGKGASGSYASSVITVVSTSSSKPSKSTSSSKAHRHLLEADAPPGTTPAAAVTLLETLSQVAELLVPSATPATGPSSAGDQGLYVTVANVVGSNIQQQLVAAGSSMGQPPSTSGTGGDSSMLVAVPTAATNVKVSFTGDYVGPCATDAADTEAAGDGAPAAAPSLCPEGVVSVKLLYLDDASVFLGSNTSSSGRRHLLAPVAVPASDLELLSGSVQLAVGDQQQLPCDNSSSSSSSCSASLSIPLSSTVTAGDPQVQCLLLEGGAAYRGGAAGDGLVTAAVGTTAANCTVKQSGTYAVGRVRSIAPAAAPPPPTSTSSSSSSSPDTSTTTSTPTSSSSTSSSPTQTDVPSNTTAVAPSPSPSAISPSASPVASPSSSPSPAPQLGAAENSTAASADAAPAGNTHDVTMLVTFPIDYNSLTADPEKEAAFKDSIINSVATALKVPRGWVTVTRLRSGSVIADVVVSVPSDSYSPQQAAALTAMVADQPDEVFQQLKQTYGINGAVGVQVVTLNEAKHSNAVSVGVGVGLGVGGALVAAFAVFVVVRRRRQHVHVQATVGGPTAAPAAPTTAAITAAEATAPSGNVAVWPTFAWGQSSEQVDDATEVRGEAQLG